MVSTAVATPLAAQSANSAITGRKRIGVVLSGGSAKGFAHIGVLRELERAGLPIDVITGTSMGSLVGGLYAIGYTPDEIEHVARTQDWTRLFSDAAERRALAEDGTWLDPSTRLTFPVVRGRVGLPTGLVRGQHIWQLLATLTWPAVTVREFRDLPIPFAAVATDVETGAAVVLDRGSLADALRASMSLPAVFTPFEVDGHLLIDGGIVRNLPSREARDLGADLLICSDVSGPLQAGRDLGSFVDVLLQTVSFQMEASTVEQRRLCDVIVRPELSGLSSGAFDQAAAWIERGAVATRDAQEEILRIAGPAADERLPRNERDGGANRSAPLPVAAVSADGARPGGLHIARRLLAAAPSLTPSARPEDIDRVITEMYGTGLFDRVTYRVVESPTQGRTLAFDVRDATQDSLSLGFRYDTRYQAALLLSTTLRDRVRYGSSSRIDVRAGEQFSLYAQYLDRAGLASHFLLGVDGSYTRTPLDVYMDGRRVVQARSTVTNASIFAGVAIRQSLLGRLQLKAEHVTNETAIAVEDVSQSQDYLTIIGTLAADTLDRRAFSRRGAALLMRSEVSAGWLTGGDRFWQQLLEGRAAMPVARRVTVNVRGTVGASGGDDLPFHYLFFLGGINTSAVFADRQIAHSGLKAQERFGRVVQAARAGAQLEVRENVFVTAHAEAGDVFDRWRFAPRQYRTGFGVSLGAVTAFGPAEVSLGTRNGSDGTRVEVRFGHTF